MRSVRSPVALNGLGWASLLDRERLWAVEDCRQLTGWLERQLLSVGEQLVRVPPKLTVPERRAGRTRGKSEQRLRWHLHQRDPTYLVPLRRLDRAWHLDRVARWLASREPGLQVRLARELVSIRRALNRAISKLDDELEQRTAQVTPTLLELPGCASLTAAKLLAEIGPIDRFKTDAQQARHGGVARLEASSGRTQRHRLDRGGNRQLNAALYRIAITQARCHAPARDYLERKRAEGKSRRGALRCLKRQLARVDFNTLKASAALTQEQHWPRRRSRCHKSCSGSSW